MGNMGLARCGWMSGTKKFKVCRAFEVMTIRVIPQVTQKRLLVKKSHPHTKTYITANVG